MTALARTGPGPEVSRPRGHPLEVFFAPEAVAVFVGYRVDKERLARMAAASSGPTGGSGRT